MSIPGIKDAPDDFILPPPKPKENVAPVEPQWKPIERGSIMEKDQFGNLRTNDPRNYSAMLVSDIDGMKSPVWVGFDMAGSIGFVAQPMLPEYIHEVTDGKYEAKCVCCDRYTELLVGLDEIPQEGYEHYCYGSPSCCP